MHHDAVAELEDLQGEDGAREEDQREREQGELHHVVGVRGVRVVLLRERGGGAPKSGIRPPAPVPENIEIEMLLRRRGWGFRV